MEKTWSGAVVDSGDIPASVSFSLLQNSTPVQTLSLSAPSWSGDFGTWPVVDDFGHPYTYTGKDQVLLNFSPEIKKTERSNATVFEINNESLLEPPPVNNNPPTEDPDDPPPVPPDPPVKDTPSRDDSHKSSWVPEPPDEQPAELPPAKKPEEKNPGTGGGAGAAPQLPALLLCMGGIALLLSRRYD